MNCNGNRDNQSHRMWEEEGGGILQAVFCCSPFCGVAERSLADGLALLAVFAITNMSLVVMHSRHEEF